MGKITYFNKYPVYKGDVSMSGCSMSKADLDNNFFNLKGEDIEKLYWDEDKRELVAVLYDGTKFAIDNINPYKLSLNVAKQELTGVTLDGQEFSLLASVSTDGSIEGKGTIDDPLTLAQRYRSGFYEPVKSVVSEIPSGEDKDGARYLYEVTEDNIGRAYTKEEVKKISDYLKEIKSEWRVSTTQDWNNMLNACEPCDADRNHDTISPAGMSAGDALKDEYLWNGYDTYGFCILPYFSGACYAAFGTTDRYKFFDEESGKVYCADNDADYYFIRLVKDGIYHAQESILGETYDCVKMPAWDKEVIASNIWTAKNLNLAELSGETIGQAITGDKVSNAYYIIEYDARLQDWVKYQVKEGYSVYCVEDGLSYTIKWDGSQYTLESIKNYFDTQLVILKAYIKEQNDALEKKFDERIQVLEDVISASTKEGIENLKEIYKRINENIVILDNKLSAEIDTRIEEDDRLEALIDEQKENLSAETIARIEAIEEVKHDFEDKLSAETIERIVADDDLRQSLSGLQEHVIEEVDYKIETLSGVVETNIKTLKSDLNKINLDLSYKIQDVNTDLRGLSGGVQENLVKSLIYDTDENYIYLQLNDGSSVSGFSADKFTQKSFLDHTELDGTILYFYFKNEAGEIEVQSVDLADLVKDVKGVTDVIVNGESVVTNHIAYIEDFGSKTTEDITVTGQYAGEYQRGDVIEAGTSLETVVTKMLGVNQVADNKEKAIAGALNFLWAKMLDKHPDLEE